MRNEKEIYIDINNVLGNEKNILERAISINDFCQKIKTKDEKNKYLSHFSKSITNYFAAMYLTDLFDDTKNHERKKFIIFTDAEAEIAYIFIKCIRKKENKIKNMENFSQNIIKNFRLINSHNDIKNILDFLDNKYELYKKVFQNETITFSILNFENKAFNEELLEKYYLKNIPKHYFLFHNNNIEISLLNELSFAICIALINKEDGIPYIIKEKLKSLGFLDIDNYNFNVQLKILKISLAIGLSYELPFEICYKNNLKDDIKKEYNSLLMFILTSIL